MIINRERTTPLNNRIFPGRWPVLCALTVCIALVLLVPDETFGQRRRMPSKRRRTAVSRQTFCDANVCPNQTLFKLDGCPANLDINSFTRQLTTFFKRVTLDPTLRIEQVGSGCLFLARSAFRSARQLQQRFTSFQNNFVAVRRLATFLGLDNLRVGYVEANFKIRLEGSPIEGPNDEFYQMGRQWGLRTAFPGIDAVSAWRNFGTGSSEIVVGVIDTGILYTHPDLLGNIWCAPEDFDVQVAGQTVHCPKGSHGYNALTTDVAKMCKPIDGQGHGTHIAGIIGASGNNIIGVTGINWMVKLMGLRIADNSGLTCISKAINAVAFAIQVAEKLKGKINLRVLNNSWGYNASSGCEANSNSLKEIIEAANLSNMLFVTSAGQRSSDNNTDIAPHYPSGFSALPNVISVTAIDNLGDLSQLQAGYANYGKESVHLGAPGSEIFSTGLFDNGEPYQERSGTSMSAAFVSGGAALILSIPKCSNLGAPELKQLILKGAQETPSLKDKTVTNGRLNVYRSIAWCGK